jgi:hypothetical protein
MGDSRKVRGQRSDPSNGTHADKGCPSPLTPSRCYLAAGDGKAPRLFPTFEDGHREAVLCEAILQSHRKRRWVDIPA